MTRLPAHRVIALGWTALTITLLACDPAGSASSAPTPAPLTDSAAKALPASPKAHRTPLIPSHPDALPAESDVRVLSLDELQDESVRAPLPSADTQDANAMMASEERGNSATAVPMSTARPPATAGASAEPEVKRLVIARSITDREPEPLQGSHAREPVTAFVELANKSDVDAAIVVTFEHESGEKVGFIELAVPSASARYRTWGRTKNINLPGKWTAVVSSKAGKELAREEFDVLAKE